MSEWISVKDKQPPIWKFVKVKERGLDSYYIAKKTLLGWWKYKSGFVGYVIIDTDFWKPLTKEEE